MLFVGWCWRKYRAQGRDLWRCESMCKWRARVCLSSSSRFFTDLSPVSVFGVAVPGVQLEGTEDFQQGCLVEFGVVGW